MYVVANSKFPCLYLRLTDIRVIINLLVLACLKLSFGLTPTAKTGTNGRQTLQPIIFFGDSL